MYRRCNDVRAASTVATVREEQGARLETVVVPTGSGEGHGQRRAKEKPAPERGSGAGHL
jgi:hypothetical protein